MKVDLNGRQKGVLLHITSLPSNFGIGGLGNEAAAFIDYLKGNDYRYWQILPLNYPGFGDSPYNPISSFAGNPYLIDPENLFQQGLISNPDLQAAKHLITGKLSYPVMMKRKQKVLRTAFTNYISLNRRTELEAYLNRESSWLKAFAVFCHFKDVYKGLSWQKWKPEHRFYPDTLFDWVYSKQPMEILYHVFLQFIFDSQLAMVKKHAVEQGIQIIGDLPLYVSLDSSDVWSSPDLFELDENGHPLRVAGVPPDAFSETGQLWGNPLYRWDKMQENGFDWWKRRLARNFIFADKLRIDHFIGLVNYWAVDAKEKTAISGKWIPGPKYAFFDSMLPDFPKESFIAEDLGILTDEVNNLRDHYGFPGMIILQFCFEHEHNDILSFPANKVIYTGTHDNQTTLGWFLRNQKQQKPDNLHLESYLHKIGMLPRTSGLTSQNVAQLMIELANASPCHLAITPMQDILSLDDKARMNIPGTPQGNWRWRMP